MIIDLFSNCFSLCLSPRPALCQLLRMSLGKISGEIDSITRQLAEGSLDDLAIKHRYLDYKFGEAAQTSPQLEDKS